MNGFVGVMDNEAGAAQGARHKEAQSFPVEYAPLFNNRRGFRLLAAIPPQLNIHRVPGSTGRAGQEKLIAQSRKI